MLARTGAPNPIEESWRLEQKHSDHLLRQAIQLEDKNIKEKGFLESVHQSDLSEIVFSMSTKAPPHMKSMSFVSICI